MQLIARVELVGVLQKLAGKGEMALKLGTEASIRDVISKLVSSFGTDFKHALIGPELNDPRPNVLVLLNGTEMGMLEGLETRVKNEDKLVLVPVSHGG